jgi:hypothetical protein
MPTTTRYFLNALRKAGRKLPTPTRGMWHEDVTFLSNYAADIDLQGQLSGTHLSHSVPSVFQRPIQFYHSLAKEGNPLHDAVVSEWRGFMATFALSRWLDLDVEARPYSVPPTNPAASSQVGASGNRDLHFNTILRNQLPKPEDWDKWWLVYCDRALLGATSPWTVLYTAAQYKAPASIPWQREGLLIDPIEHYDPQQDRMPMELSILYAWVTAILENQPNWGMPSHLGLQKKAVSEGLETWQRKLAKYQRPNLQLNQYSSLFEAPPLSVILQQPEDLMGKDSDLLLQSRKLGAGRVLVFSENLPDDKRVYRGVFANQVNVDELDAEGNRFATRTGKLVQHAYVVADRLFFPQKLVELHFSESALRRGVGPVSVPLTAEFFKYFDHADLVDIQSLLTVNKAGDSYKAVLRLPLRNGSTLVVEKTYAQHDIVRLNMQTPAFAVWPDFHDEGWRENFAAYAAPERDDLRVRPLFSDGSQGADEARVGTHQRDVRIWPCVRPAIGFALAWRDEVTNEVVKVGLVLRDVLRGPRPINRQQRWDVGVDFGTSSTTVMVNAGNGGPVAMPFQGRTIFLTAPEETERLSAIANSLYPATGTTPPFRTLLYEAAAHVFGRQSTTYTLRFTSQAAQDVVNKPVRDVKWGRQAKQGGESPLMAYLEGLVRYIVCEARSAGVGNLAFHWSFPLSLPSGALTTMGNFWAGIAGRYSTAGMNVVVESSVSESEAVCRCLANVLKVRGGSLTIAVDVGGGSTDVAFWSEKKLLDQFSFKVAGNDVLDPKYLSREALSELFEICYGRSIPEGEGEQILERPEIYLNGALTEAKDVTGQPFRDIDPRRHPVPCQILGHREGVPPWVDFRSMIYVFFSGLAYYLGLHTRTVTVPLDGVEIYVAGRGSSLLTWLASTATTNDVLCTAFKAGLSYVGGMPEMKFKYPNSSPKFTGLPIRFSPEYPPLKIEVARGLLSSQLELGRASSIGAVIGETLWTKNEIKQEWDTRLSAEDMARLAPPDDFASTTLGNFLTEILRHKDLPRSLNLDDKKLAKLHVTGADVQDLIRQLADGEDHIVQPVFAYELKVLMQKYAEMVTGAAKSQPAGV